jgi:catechol 2,3-dioxygenase-like lactoylglutathione lyase family enzyme
VAQSLAHVALVVRDYDEAIAWFTAKLGFTLVADDGGGPFALSGGQRSPTIQPEQDKRWVLIAPPGAAAGGASLLLARAATPEQERFIGDQAGGRVFLFLETDDFDRDHAAMVGAGVRFVRAPKQAPYGTVAVFEDLYGNLWDLVQFGDPP